MIQIVTCNHGFKAWSRSAVAEMLHAVALAITDPLTALPSTNPSKAIYLAGVEITLRAVCAAFGLVYDSGRRGVAP